MTPDVFLSCVVDRGLKFLHDKQKIVVMPQARVMLVAIGGQESGWAARRQYGGPARSYFQCERGGAIHGVMNHPASKAALQGVVSALDIPWDEATIYEAIAWNDTLAVCLARLLLFTDPRPLPAIGDQTGAWDAYIRLWRPGKPKPETWPDRYGNAVRVVAASP